MVYLHGIEPGKYLASWPVYIIGDDKNNLTFKAALENIATLLENGIATYQLLSLKD